MFAMERVDGSRKGGIAFRKWVGIVQANGAPWHGVRPE